MSADLCNAWAVYWAPGETDRFGKQLYADPVAILVNWRSGIDRQLDMDGDAFTINNSVVSSSEMTAKGCLLKSDLGVKTVTNSDDVLARHSNDSPPREGIIKAVTYQGDFDCPDDIVYSAMV